MWNHREQHFVGGHKCTPQGTGSYLEIAKAEELVRRALTGWQLSWGIFSCGGRKVFHARLRIVLNLNLNCVWCS